MTRPGSGQPVVHVPWRWWAGLWCAFPEGGGLACGACFLKVVGWLVVRVPWRWWA